MRGQCEIIRDFHLPPTSPRDPSPSAYLEGSSQRGLVIAFGYSSNAHAECNVFHKRTGRIIKLLTVQEILDETRVQKM